MIKLIMISAIFALVVFDFLSGLIAGYKRKNKELKRK